MIILLCGRKGEGGGDLQKELKLKKEKEGGF